MNRSIQKIMVIDDDPSFGSVLRRMGAHRGIAVDVYESLLEALYDTELSQYDAAVLDCMMPHIKGAEVAEYLTALVQSVPVILMSSSTQELSRQYSQLGNAAGAIPKSLGPRLLWREIIWTLQESSHDLNSLQREEHHGTRP